MKKIYAVFIAIFLVIIALTFYFYNDYVKAQNLSKRINVEFEKYTENTIVGSSLITLINKVTDYNEKNNISKGYDDLYQENTKNSIKIEIRFLESDKTFPMESISRLGSEEFVKNYSSRLFKCTTKEYHKETGQLKYLLFEEVQDI